MSPTPFSSSTDVQRPPPIVLSHSTFSQSSVDSLRTVHRQTSTTITRSFSSSSSTSQTSLATALEETQPATASSWWWFPDSLTATTTTNKEGLLSEEDKSAAQRSERKYKHTKNPIVFCHGLLGFDSVKIGPAIAPVEVTHWRGIKEVLEENGNEVLITRVPATSSPVDRAKVLEERISQVYPGRSVHLIGHSMGGLDCRFLTKHLTNRKFNVLSVTTIATPHRGSSFADHFLHELLGASRLPQLLTMLELLPNGGGDGTAFSCLTLAEMAKFNENVPNVPDVKYFSWGAVYEPGLIDTWKYPHGIILEKEGPNDGLVSVESAKWGTYLGTLHGVNHLDLVGWINTARYKWAEIMGKEIKFRPATFYLGIADMLSKEVEGQKEDGEEGEQVEGADIEREGGKRSQTPEPMKDGEGSGEATVAPTPTQSGNATPLAASRTATTFSNVQQSSSSRERERTPPEVHAQGRMLDSIDSAEKQQGRVEGVRVEGESKGHREESRQHKEEEVDERDENNSKQAVSSS